MLFRSALYGKSNAEATSLSAGDAFPYVLDARSGVALLVGKGINLQTSALMDTRKVYRLDGEQTVNLAGTHRFRGGFDREDVASNSNVQYSGGTYWRYVATAPGKILANGAVVPAGVTQYARKRIYSNSGMFATTSSAFYLEDNWQPIGERLVLSFGLRDETFDNKKIGRAHV